MKVYVTVTAPTRTAKTTMTRIIERALKSAGFPNVFNSDPDRDVSEVGLHLIEDDRIREWANATPVYLLALKGEVERKKVALTEKEQLQREYRKLLERAKQLNVKLENDP